MKNKLTAIYIIAICVLLGIAMVSCNHKAPQISDNDGVFSNTDLSIIRIGTHQYLGYELGKLNGLLCHYEDCDNPIHPQNQLYKPLIPLSKILGLPKFLDTIPTPLVSSLKKHDESLL